MPPLMEQALGSAPLFAEEVPPRAGAPNENRRTNVLHLIAPSEVGGAESVVRLLAAQQQSLGAKVDVAAIVQSESTAADLRAELRRAGVGARWVKVGGRAYRREQRTVA